MNEELTLDSFRPLIEADEKRRRAAADFLNARNRAEGFLRDIRARQEAERNKYREMLSELKAEEQSLRQKVREEAAARAKAAVRGEKAPRADTSTGARLAALPDEMAAIEALIPEQRMTHEECEAWTKIVMELNKCTTAFRQAAHAARGELVKWKDYFLHVNTTPEWGINDDVSRIIQSGYELNRAADKELERG